MRTMLLSLKPEVYDKIVSGSKIFEHRRSFPNEPIRAYLYVSSPVCAIKGILYLGKRHSLIEWKETYASDEDALRRINEYEKNYKYAMEISEFQETSSISLETLRNKLDKFVVPQMYYYLDGTELLNFIEMNIKVEGVNVKHTFDSIDSSKICNS